MRKISQSTSYSVDVTIHEEGYFDCNWRNTSLTFEFQNTGSFERIQLPMICWMKKQAETVRQTEEHWCFPAYKFDAPSAIWAENVQ